MAIVSKYLFQLNVPTLFLLSWFPRGSVWYSRKKPLSMTFETSDIIIRVGI